MSSNSLGDLAGYQGDQGDEQDGGVQQEITDLEARVSAIEQKLGMGSGESESPMPAKKPMSKPGGKMPFLGA